MLAAEPSPDVQFYVVWLNQRSTDARETIDATTVDDPRVKQYWDADGVTGTYFADADVGGLGYSGFVYDVYYVFGPNATWRDEPEPLLDARVPVVAYAEELRAAIARR